MKRFFLFFYYIKSIFESLSWNISDRFQSSVSKQCLLLSYLLTPLFKNKVKTRRRQSRVQNGLAHYQSQNQNNPFSAHSNTVFCWHYSQFHAIYGTLLWLTLYGSLIIIMSSLGNYKSMFPKAKISTKKIILPNVWGHFSIAEHYMITNQKNGYFSTSCTYSRKTIGAEQ